MRAFFEDLFEVICIITAVPAWVLLIVGLIG